MKTLELNPSFEVNGAKPTPEKNKAGIQMHLDTCVIKPANGWS